MKCIFRSSWLFVLSLLLAVSGVSMAGPSLEDRVKRLERMLENPAMFQMSELLAQQQREIQSLQDRLDRLEYQYHKRLLRQQAQIDSLQKRLDRLYAHLREKGLAPEEEAEEADNLIPPEEEREEGVEQERTGAGEAAEVVEPAGVQLTDVALKESAGTDASSVEETETGRQKGAHLNGNAADPSSSDQEDKGISVSEKDEQRKTATLVSLHPPTEEEQALYEEGMMKLRQYRYEDATRLLDRFVQQYPDSELAPQALYWAADAEWMVQEQPEGAWRRFNQIIQRYPNTFLMPKVLYRGARALHQMQQDEEAQGLLKRLMEEYPGTEEAERAARLLNQLVEKRAPLLQEEPAMKGVDITVGKESKTHE